MAKFLLTNPVGILERLLYFCESNLNFKTSDMVKLYKNIKTTLLAFMLLFAGGIFGQITITLGTGTTAGGSTTAGPINQYYRSLHCQIVYTAAELNAAGICGGIINKLGFYVNSGTTYPLPNYTIKMGHTTAPNVAIYNGTGLTTVYTTPSYTPTAGGFDMLTLNTPFIWNGADNILIDVCFDQVPSFTSTGTVRNYSPTVPNGFIFVRSDSAPQCGIACSSTSSNKPQIQFEFATPAAIDLGVSAILKPTAKRCFGNDTLIAKIQNFGTNPIDFSVNQAVLTVQTTGATTSTYSVTINTGSLAACASQVFTLTNSYNTSFVGTYYIKGFTTVAGDGLATNDTLITTIVRNPLFTKSFTANDSVCRGVPVQLAANYSNNGTQIGNGTLANTSTSYPAPYGNWYESARHQFLFLASELLAAGLTPGNINGISFNATALNGTDPLTNFNIGVATTTMTAMTAFQTSGFTTYFNSPSYVPVLGANNHTFSTPFVWNGTDNIIIETCFDNTASGYSSNVSISQSTTPFTSSIWYRQDATPGLCGMNTITGTMSQRPNISFVQPQVVTYTWTPSIGLSATNIANPTTTLTASNTYSVMVDVNGCLTYDTLRVHILPTPVPSLGNDTLLCSTPYNLASNTAASSYVWSNSATTSSISVTLPGTYWVKGMNSNGCIGSDTINITIGSKPIVTLGPDTAFCQGSSIVLHAGNSPGNYLWNTGATTNTINVTTPGTYSVTVTDPSTCKTSDIINVTVKSKPTVALTFTGQTVFCPNESGHVLNEGTPSGGIYIGSGVTGGNVFNANQAGNGTYIILYNYTGPNGCSNIAKDTLKVNNCGVGIEELADNIGLNVYPNPNNGEFTIEINSASDIDGHVKVLAIDSRLVFEDAINGNGLITKTVNISELADGIYYLRLETKNAVKTYKILKQ